jgi:hypothetical protein
VNHFQTANEKKACLLRNYPQCKINKKSFDFFGRNLFQVTFVDGKWSRNEFFTIRFLNKKLDLEVQIKSREYYEDVPMIIFEINYDHKATAIQITDN